MSMETQKNTRTAAKILELTIGPTFNQISESIHPSISLRVKKPLNFPRRDRNPPEHENFAISTRNCAREPSYHEATRPQFPYFRLRFLLLATKQELFPTFSFPLPPFFVRLAFCCFCPIFLFFVLFRPLLAFAQSFRSMLFFASFCPSLFLSFCFHIIDCVQIEADILVVVVQSVDDPNEGSHH